jgi:hypothetical protein
VAVPRVVHPCGLAKLNIVCRRKTSAAGLAVLIFSSVAAAAPAPEPAQTQTPVQVQVRERGCRQGVELVADNAPLAAVLQRLSSTLGFRLEVEGQLIGTVSKRATAEPARLLAELLVAQQGHAIWYTSDPRCAQQRRLARVRIVARAAAFAGATSAAGPGLVVDPSRAPATETATPQQLREVERAASRRKEEYSAYLRGHGEPPPGVQEEAARP